MKRKPCIAANWKMNKTHHEAQLFVEGLRNRLHADDYERVDIVICPPFTALRTVQTTIDGDQLPLHLGAQDMHWDPSGAFTGEVSAPMLAKLNVNYVIIGHSERREFFGETDHTVNQKVRAALGNELVPIVCVGESLEQRETHETQSRLSAQVRTGLAGISREQMASVVVAYEPIWAIGTGLTATPELAQETIGFLRDVLRDMVKEAADSVRIQYGGSVKASNAKALMEQPDIDGALVGGASLDPEEFARIVRFDS